MAQMVKRANTTRRTRLWEHPSSPRGVLRRQAHDVTHRESIGAYVPCQTGFKQSPRVPLTLVRLRKRQE